MAHVLESSCLPPAGRGSWKYKDQEAHSQGALSQGRAPGAGWIPNLATQDWLSIAGGGQNWIVYQTAVTVLLVSIDATQGQECYKPTIKCNGDKKNLLTGPAKTGNSWALG